MSDAPAKTTTPNDACSVPSDLVNINIGGSQFMTYKSTLKSVPGTRLASISTDDKEYIQDKNSYFFDRHADLFPYILDLYRKGSLHFPKHICGASVREELEFWEISLDKVSECCFPAITKYDDDMEIVKKLRTQFENNGLEYTPEEIKRSSWCSVKNLVWNFLYNPRSSTAAKVFSFVYFLIVALTVFVFVVHTCPAARYPTLKNITVPFGNTTIEIPNFDYFLFVFGNNTKLAMLLSTKEYPVFMYAERACFAFFVLEILLRFASCPKKCKFFGDVFNVLDSLLIISTTISLTIQLVGIWTEATFWTFMVFRGFIILRVLRMLRLARLHSGLKVLYLAISASSKELLLLCVTFVIAVTLFSSLMYYAEFWDKNGFENVPIAIWWAVVTMTTVGYGDYYPTTPWGYVVGSLCAMCGICLLAMPIAIIAANFDGYYSWHKIREKRSKLRDTRHKDRACCFERMLCCRNYCSSNETIMNSHHNPDEETKKMSGW